MKELNDQLIKILAENTMLTTKLNAQNITTLAHVDDEKRMLQEVNKIYRDALEFYKNIQDAMSNPFIATYAIDQADYVKNIYDKKKIA